MTRGNNNQPLRRGPRPQQLGLPLIRAWGPSDSYTTNFLIGVGAESPAPIVDSVSNNLAHFIAHALTVILATIHLLFNIEVIENMHIAHFLNIAEAMPPPQQC